MLPGYHPSRWAASGCGSRSSGTLPRVSGATRRSRRRTCSRPWRSTEWRYLVITLLPILGGAMAEESPGGATARRAWVRVGPLPRGAGGWVGCGRGGGGGRSGGARLSRAGECRAQATRKRAGPRATERMQVRLRCDRPSLAAAHAAVTRGPAGACRHTYTHERLPVTAIASSETVSDIIIKTIKSTQPHTTGPRVPRRAGAAANMQQPPGRPGPGGTSSCVE